MNEKLKEKLTSELKAKLDALDVMEAALKKERKRVIVEAMVFAVKAILVDAGETGNDT